MQKRSTMRRIGGYVGKWAGMFVEPATKTERITGLEVLFTRSLWGLEQSGACWLALRQALVRCRVGGTGGMTDSNQGAANPLGWRNELST